MLKITLVKSLLYCPSSGNRQRDVEKKDKQRGYDKMGAKNLQIFNNVGRMLLFDHLDNFEITLIRAPFSSRRRWLSFFKCSSCYKNKKKCHYINALAFRNYPLKLAVKRQCYAVREKSRQDLNNEHPNDRQIRIADNIQAYTFQSLDQTINVMSIYI